MWGSHTGFSVSSSNLWHEWQKWRMSLTRILSFGPLTSKYSLLCVLCLLEVRVLPDKTLRVQTVHTRICLFDLRALLCFTISMSLYSAKNPGAFQVHWFLNTEQPQQVTSSTRDAGRLPSLLLRSRSVSSLLCLPFNVVPLEASQKHPIIDARWNWLQVLN